MLREVTSRDKLSDEELAEYFKRKGDAGATVPEHMRDYMLGRIMSRLLKK